jgi:hypothetical protein
MKSFLLLLQKIPKKPAKYPNNKKIGMKSGNCI